MHLRSMVSGALYIPVKFIEDNQIMNLALSTMSYSSGVVTTLCDSCNTTHKLDVVEIQSKQVMYYDAFDNDKLKRSPYYMSGDEAILDFTNWQDDNHFQKLRLPVFGITSFFDDDHSIQSSEIDGWISLFAIKPKVTYSHANIDKIYSIWANSNANGTSYWEIGGQSQDAVLPGHKITVLGAEFMGFINLDKITMSINNHSEYNINIYSKSVAIDPSYPGIHL